MEKIRIQDPGWKQLGSATRVVDPDSIGSVDPDSESGSGSRRAKMTLKSRQKFVKVHVLKVLDGLFLRAEGFFYNLDILYGGLGIG
jgi:hypothetical protein